MSSRLRPSAWLVALIALCTAGSAAAVSAPPVRGQGIGGAVLIGTSAENPPYAYLDAQGVPSGYGVELARGIAEVTGIRIEFRFGTVTENRAALLSGKVDLLLAMPYTEERAKLFALTVPHVTLNYSLFAREGAAEVSELEQVRGHGVAVQAGGLIHQYLQERGFEPGLVPVQTQVEALRLLEEGRQEYAVVGTLAGEHILRDYHIRHVKAVARGVGPEVRLSMAARKGDEKLLSVFNEGMGILQRTGRFTALQEKWLLERGTGGIPWRLLARYSLLGPVPLLALLGLAMIWSRTLRRQVEVRTAALRREITEREQAEARLREKQQELVQADKMAALGVLVSGVAHEINNPNGLVLLNLPLLARIGEDALRQLEPLDDGALTVGGLPYAEARAALPSLLEDTAAASQRIKRIVADLKDFARRDPGERRANSIDAIVEAAVRMVEPVVQKSTTRFVVDLAPGLAPIECNAQRVEQVIVNLLLNACEALPSPDRGVRVSTRERAAPAAVIVEVEDEGVGIPAEALPRIQEPFFTTRRTSGGTGLGLSISGEIAKEHGGTLEVISAPGRGTRVTLVLPRGPGGAAS